MYAESLNTEKEEEINVRENSNRSKMLDKKEKNRLNVKLKEDKSTLGFTININNELNSAKQEILK